MRGRLGTPVKQPGSRGPIPLTLRGEFYPLGCEVCGRSRTQKDGVSESPRAGFLLLEVMEEEKGAGRIARHPGDIGANCGASRTG